MMANVFRSPAAVAQGAAGAIILVATIVLAAWVFQLPVLQSFLPEWPRMAVITALNFELAGVSLWCATVANGGSTKPAAGERARNAARAVARVSAALIILLSVLTLIESAVGSSAGVHYLDRILSGNTAGVRPPAGPAPTTALSFLFLATALVLPTTARYSALFQLLALLGGVMSWLGFSQYLFAGAPLVPFAEMAIHAALLLIVFCAGVLCLRPNIGLIALLRNSRGRLLAAHLVPAVILVPFIFSLLRLQGQRLGWFGTEQPPWLFAFANTLVFGGLIWRTATLLERSDSEQRKAARALRESREHYQALAESLPHLVWTCDGNGRCDYLSRQWEEYTGQSTHEQFGCEYMHPDDRERVLAAWAEAVRRRDRFENELRIRRADGQYRWFKSQAIPLRDADGRVVKWFGSNTDFQDHKCAEQTLKNQLQQLKMLDEITRAIGERQDLDSIFQVVIRSLEGTLPIDFVCVCLYDAEPNTLTVTRVGVGSLELALQLALSEQAKIQVDQSGLSKAALGRLEYETDISRSEFSFQRRLLSGGLRSVVTAPLLFKSHVFGIIVVARRQHGGFSSSDCEFLRQLSEHVGLAAHQAQMYADIQKAYEDRRQTQQTVMQQQRFRALGQMASGVAHDINNALSPAALYVDSILERETGLSARARDYLTNTQRAIDSVTHTVSRMQEFYRKREAEMLAPVNLNSVVQQVVELAAARWSDMPQQRGIVIRVESDFQAGLPAITGIESEIQEALLNLIFNAVDAMPEGGTLTLRTRLSPKLNEDRSPAQPESELLGYVELEIIDSGVGMDEETRRRCLEPFFTTKGARGTGLGLPLVYGMAERHNAAIEIESSPGAGTTVRLSFPVLSGAAPRPVRAINTDSVPSGLRILLVDDDPLTVASLRDTLQADGHKTTTGYGGQEGIDIFEAAEQNGESFAVVITDLGMPYVDGRKVATAVKAANPRTPVILLTGWGSRLLSEGDVPANVDRVLSKPPRLRELRNALAELTAAASRTSL
jgi:PAS domain S-box-containing protein